MTTVSELASSAINRDELEAVTSMLQVRCPSHNREELERLVSDTYERLSDTARIRSHLIPLTLNHCRRVLASVDARGLLDRQDSREFA